MIFPNSRRYGKGTLDIEFMISVIVFLTSISFVSIAVINNVPKLHQETLSQDIKSKSFQISEMLMFDRGEPPQWASVPEAKRLGLSNGTKYFIDSSKYAALGSYCNDPGNSQANYQGVKELLGLDFRNDVTINVTELGSAQLASCGPGVASEIKQKSVITRLAIDSSTGRIVLLTVSVL